MRFVVFIDLLIDKDKALAKLKEYGDFMKKETGIDPVFWVERRDFSQVPTVPDGDGDLKPTHAYRQALCDDVHRRYHDYGTDYVLMWVHEDNFLYKGVWGTAWAYIHYKYNFLLCRWDKKNGVNTFNTLFHEAEHPHDTTIQKELGVDIEKLITAWLLENGTKKDKEYVTKNGFDFDRDYVHGKLPSMTYIGQKGYTLSDANLKILRFIAPHLKMAYAKRKAKHQAYIDKQKTIVGLLQQLVAKLIQYARAS